jgi:hypothetical protein
MTNEITKRSNVRTMVAAYQEAVDDVKKAFEIMQNAESKVNQAFNSSGGYDTTVILQPRNAHREVDWKNPKPVLQEMKRSAWRVIVNRLEIKSILSSKAKKEMDKHLERDDLPEITYDNVMEFCEGYATSMPTLFEDSVKEVFSWLRPTYTNYKTNSQYELGNKVIIFCLRDPKWMACHGVDHYKSQDLIVLENVFRTLDGKGQRAKGYISELELEIQKLRLDGDGKGETEYFRFKYFKNQNLHLEFRRMDLVKKLNMIAGGKTLRKAANVQPIDQEMF